MLRRSLLSSSRCLANAAFSESKTLSFRNFQVAPLSVVAFPRTRLLEGTTFKRNFSGGPQKTVKITFRDKDGDTETVEANVGDSILDVAFDHDIEIEGACGGEIACSTCHVILDQTTFDSLPEAEEEEEDMLDLALGLTNTSRLGCQVIVTEEMDGITVQLPEETANLQ
mmetsp:Transcript_5534/g.6428  ORF Transcript_5534/g.6428 Transcript_5534/m.6428 type:complete len:169 (-) Transcript_5534:1540-2046(-)